MWLNDKNRQLKWVEEYQEKLLGFFDEDLQPYQKELFKKYIGSINQQPRIKVTLNPKKLKGYSAEVIIVDEFENNLPIEDQMYSGSE